MATSALIVKVPEAEQVVHPLRARFDATSHFGVPAHITILFPFMDPSSVTLEVLQRLQRALNSTPAFSYSLTSIGHFEATTYLAPSLPEPFISLTTAVTKEFPDFPPYEGQYAEVIPHLTVVHENASHTAAATIELEKLLRTNPAIQGECRAVTMIENSSGRWEEMHVFELPR